MIRARHFVTGLVGKARALFHGLGPKGDHPSREARTLRLSNIGVSSVIDGGKSIHLYGWSHTLPTEGDYLILPNGGETTRYRATSVRYPGDPSDMFFAEAEFAPR